MASSSASLTSSGVGRIPFGFVILVDDHSAHALGKIGAVSGRGTGDAILHHHIVRKVVQLHAFCQLAQRYLAGLRTFGPQCRELHASPNRCRRHQDWRVCLHNLVRREMAVYLEQVFPQFWTAAGSPPMSPIYRRSARHLQTQSLPWRRPTLRTGHSA